MARPADIKPPALVPGMIAWASTWPDWERIAGQESPHPILIIGNNQDGEVAVLPLSSKPDLGRFQLAITREVFPSAFTPKGPLSVSPSYVCIADRQGALTMRWAAIEPGALVLPKGRINLRKMASLAPDQWRRLQQQLGVEVQRAQERAP